MKGKRVLVVDDEIHIVHVVAIKLRNNGYEVLSAHNGAEAFELACKHQPDIIVTDFQMPVMTGMELVEKLREHFPFHGDEPFADEVQDLALERVRARVYKVREGLLPLGLLVEPRDP